MGEGIRKPFASQRMKTVITSIITLGIRIKEEDKIIVRKELKRRKNTATVASVRDEKQPASIARVVCESREKNKGKKIKTEDQINETDQQSRSQQRISAIEDVVVVVQWGGNHREE